MTPLLTLKVCAGPATVSKPNANWRKHTRCKHDVDRCKLRAYTLHAFPSHCTSHHLKSGYVVVIAVTFERTGAHTICCTSNQSHHQHFSQQPVPRQATRKLSRNTNLTSTLTKMIDVAYGLQRCHSIQHSPANFQDVCP